MAIIGCDDLAKAGSQVIVATRDLFRIAGTGATYVAQAGDTIDLGAIYCRGGGTTTRLGLARVSDGVVLHTVDIVPGDTATTTWYSSATTFDLGAYAGTEFQLFQTFFANGSPTTDPYQRGPGLIADAVHLGQYANTTPNGMQDFDGEWLGENTVNLAYFNVTQSASGPTLTTVPATAYDGQTLNITGTNLTGATADFGGETASVSVVSGTEINVTISQGGLKFATHTLTVTTAGGSATSDIELIVEPGTGDYINVVDPNTTDTTAFAYQVEDSLSNPVVTGDQFQWRYTGLTGDVTAMTVGADTRPTSLDQEGDVDGRFWDATDSTWSAWYTFTAAVPDEVASTVSSVSVPTAGSYAAGQNLDFTVNASETVTVTTTGGTPSIPVTIGATVRQATYVSGSGTSALLFRYTTQAGDNDGDGISVGSSISLNGGTIQDGASNNLVLTLNSIGDTSGVLVDTVKPVITPNGANPANVVVGGTYTDAGATATDNIDGSLGSVAGTGSVDTNTIGQYTITYPGAGVVDSAGNVAEDATRIVNVVAEDFWPFSKGIKYAATKNWEWGKRHPKTGMRVRVYK